MHVYLSVVGFALILLVVGYILTDVKELARYRNKIILANGIIVVSVIIGACFIVLRS